MFFDQNETLESARARNVREALSEDVGKGDWTARLVPPGQIIEAQVVVKQAAVLCGHKWFEDCVFSCDRNALIDWPFEEGTEVSANALICHIKGDARALLTAERTAINFLQFLSGVSTVTHQYVRAIDGISPNPDGCRILDTRKTVPGLRHAQKYAVRVGGGKNHRMGLWDGILIKENHIAAAGGISAALEAARALHSDLDIQIEVESLQELDEALSADAANILLDDFTLDDMHKACEVNSGRACLEVSGGVDLSTVKDIAATGVNRISVGNLTKNVRAIDLSMRVISAPEQESFKR